MIIIVINIDIIMNQLTSKNNIFNKQNKYYGKMYRKKKKVHQEMHRVS